ncbi:MAG: hypothetical protein LUQ19_01275 [Methanoregula sp.]|nr:hypothetical protein [Methanoregula sp.]
MQEPEAYEQYPGVYIVVSNLLSVVIYFCGAAILIQLGIIWVAAYLIFVVWLELRLLGGHCTDCYYYGKACAFGKGWLSGKCFRKGSPEKFIQMTITWKDLVPDFLVMLIPVLAGIYLLIVEFRWLILLLMLVLLVLGSAGNAYVRGQLACRYCKQRVIGCPAQALFDKK